MKTIPSLRVIDGKLTSLSEKGPKLVSLRGMSLYWSMWGKKYWKRESVYNLSEVWCSNVIRLPVGSHDVHKGYVDFLESELKQLEPVIDAALDLGIYVIVDVHNHRAVRDKVASMGLLSAVAQKYGDSPNILYEVVNEPLVDSWEGIKTYSEQAIDAVRVFAPNAVCLVGTPDWCKDLESPLRDPVERSNLMYTYHFYAGTHRDAERNALDRAMRAELPVFISECGVSEANGDGAPDFESFDQWLDFISRHNLSWCGWAINDKSEQSSSFESDLPNCGLWSDESLTDVGLFFRNRIHGYTSKQSGIPYMGFYSSPFGRRTKEAATLEKEMDRSLLLPLSLIRVALPSIIRNSGTDNYDLFLLWLMHNYRLLDRDVKNLIALEITKFMGEGSLDPKKYWALFRLNDTVRFASTAGRVYI